MAAKKAADGSARMTHPNGTTVVVSADKVEALTGRGFTAAKTTTKSDSK